MAHGTAKFSGGKQMGKYNKAKQETDAEIGNFKDALHQSPDEVDVYPCPSRAEQLGTSARYGEGTMLGESYVGKRRVAEPVNTPGNIHAHQTLLDVTSKEYQVGKVRKQGSSPA